jgi:carbonic anhydrase/acetyltransferase-like protein (isoleucine patch superfamily)
MPLQVSIWYGAVLRGDLNAIRVGSFSNIQDKTIIHAARCMLRLAPHGKSRHPHAWH